MDNNVAQHFRVDEEPFLEDAGRWIQEVFDQNRPVLTNFLNPREQYILQTLVNRVDDIRVKFDGGFLNSELKRGLVFPDYFQPIEDDFNLAILMIDYPTKFAELEHRQILGTFANLGIERNTFGDIISEGETWQIIVNRELSNFFLNEVTRIGKIKVQLRELEMTNIIEPSEDWEETSTTVKSLRLDLVISNVFNVSRQRAKALIEHKRVRVNWSIVEKPDFELQSNDMISVRQFGRIRVEELNGETKKGKLRLTIKFIKNNS